MSTEQNQEPRKKDGRSKKKGGGEPAKKKPKAKDEFTGQASKR